MCNESAAARLNVTYYTIAVVSQELEDAIQLAPELINMGSFKVGDLWLDGPRQLGRVSTAREAIEIAKKAYAEKRDKETIRITVSRFQCDKCAEEHPNVSIGQPAFKADVTPKFINGFCPHKDLPHPRLPVTNSCFIYSPKKETA
jgi:hypothetical protein